MPPAARRPVIWAALLVVLALFGAASHAGGPRAAGWGPDGAPGTWTVATAYPTGAPADPAAHLAPADPAAHLLGAPAGVAPAGPGDVARPRLDGKPPMAGLPLRGDHQVLAWGAALAALAGLSGRPWSARPGATSPLSRRSRTADPRGPPRRPVPGYARVA